MYDDICSIDNLYRASHNALKGKKSKSSAAKFCFYEDREILQMHKELKMREYTFGGYNSFRGTTMLTTPAPLTVTGTILPIVITIGVFVSSKLFVPEFFAQMQESVPFKVHYLLGETCSNGEVGYKPPSLQRIKI